MGTKQQQVDDLGVPIKSITFNEVDDLGVPVKKKENFSDMVEQNPTDFSPLRQQPSESNTQPQPISLNGSGDVGTTQNASGLESHSTSKTDLPTAGTYDITPIPVKPTKVDILPYQRQAAELFKNKDLQGAVSVLNDGISVATGLEKAKLLKQRMNVWDELGKTKSKADFWIGQIKGEQDHSETDSQFFREKSFKDYMEYGKLTGDFFLNKGEKPLETVLPGVNIGTIAENVIGGVLEGGDKIVTGLAQATGGMPAESFDQLSHPKTTMAKGVLSAAAGAMQSTFGIVMNTTPEGILFNAATETANKTIPGAEEASQLLFAPVSALFEAKTQAGKDIASIIDPIPSMILMHMASKGSIKAEALNEKIKNNEPFTQQEAVDYTSEITKFAEDKEAIKQVADQAGVNVKTDEQIKKENGGLEQLSSKIEPTQQIIEAINTNKPFKSILAESNIPKDEFDIKIDHAKFNGDLTDEQVNIAKEEYDKMDELKKTLPDEYKNNSFIIDLVEQKNELNKQKEIVDDAFHPKIDAKIKEINNKIQEAIGETKVEPKTTEVTVNPSVVASDVAKENTQNIPTTPENIKTETTQSEVPTIKNEPSPTLSKEDFVNHHVGEIIDSGELSPSIGVEGYKQFYRNLYDKKYVNKPLETNETRTAPNSIEGTDTTIKENVGASDTGGQGVLPEGVGGGEAEVKGGELNPDSKVLSEAHAKESIDFANEMIDDGLFHSTGNVYERRPDIGLSTAEVNKAIKDIKSGKNTAPAKHLIEKLNEFNVKGEIPMIQGNGGQTTRFGLNLEDIRKDKENITELTDAERKDLAVLKVSDIIKNEDLNLSNIDQFAKENDWLYTPEELNQIKKQLNETENKGGDLPKSTPITGEGEKLSENASQKEPPLAEPTGAKQKEVTPKEKAYEESKTKAANALDRLTKRLRKEVISDHEKHSTINDLKDIAAHLVKELGVGGEKLIEALKTKVGEAYHKFIDDNKEDILSNSERVDKKVVGRAVEGEFTPEEVKTKLKEIGLDRNVKTIEEAVKKADRIIEELGIDQALAAVRRKDITESEAAIVIGRAIDKAHREYKEATTTREKEIAAQKEADLLDELDSAGVSAGRFSGALHKVYQMSPLGYKRYAIKKLEKANESVLEKKREGLDKLEKQVIDAKKESAELLEKNIELQARIDELQGKKSKSSLSPEKQQRKAELRAKITGRYNDITSIATLIADKEFYEYSKLLFEEAGGDFRAWAKEIVETAGQYVKEHMPDLWRHLGGKETESITNKSVKGGLKEMFGDSVNNKLIELSKEYFIEGEKVKGTLIDHLIKKTGLEAKELEPYAKAIEDVYDKILNKKVLSEIERAFPAPKIINKKSALLEHEKIVQAINVGLKTGLRKDGTPFDFTREFYNKFGLIDVNESGVRDKLDSFAKKIYENKDSENPLFQNIATIEMLDWIANRQHENRIAEGLTAQLYSHMLYGIDTHLRNTGFNAQVILSSLGKQIIQKPKYAGTILKAFGKDLGRGVSEMKNIVMTGMPKSGEVPTARSFVERSKEINKFMSNWSKFENKPGRLLQGMDALLSFPERKARVAYLLIDAAKKENPSMSVKEITQQVNDVLYGTDIQQQEWRGKAEQQVQKFYGMEEPLFVDGKRNPIYADKAYNEAYRNYDRSVYNLQDNNLKNESIFNEAKDYANSNLLMGKPKGWFGFGANLVNQLGEATPSGLGKVLTSPFVNVPFNIAAHAYEFSPLGYSSVLFGKEGKGLQENYAKKHSIPTDYSERRKKDLLWKATAGTLGMGVVGAMTQVEYYDEDEKKKRPLLIVTADGTGNFQQNKKLESLSGSEKFEEYTIDFMGKRMSYKYSPFAPLFLPSGYMMDAERYGDKGNGDTPEHIETLAKSLGGYFAYMKDQSSMQGVADLLNVGERMNNYASGQKPLTKLAKTAEMGGAKILKTLLFPNFIPQEYRRWKGILDKDDTRSNGFFDVLAKDIPFADQFVDKRYDHFGQPITSTWKVPGIYNEALKDNPLYQLARDKNYIDKLKYFTQTKIELSGETIPITPSQTTQIDKLRAKYAGEEVKVLFDLYKGLSNSEFKEAMNETFNDAQKKAIEEVLGVKYPDEFTLPDIDKMVSNKIKRMERKQLRIKKDVLLNKSNN